MSAVEVRAIELPRDAMRFVKSWWPIYADDPHWVPPLISERKQFLDPGRTRTSRYATVQCFLAYRDGVPVGTIAATVDHKQQEHEPGVGLFGFFEFVDDDEVAGALLDAGDGLPAVEGDDGSRADRSTSTATTSSGCWSTGSTPTRVSRTRTTRRTTVRCTSASGCRRRWTGSRTGWTRGRSRSACSRVIETASSSATRRSRSARSTSANFEREVELFFEIYNDAWEDNWGHIHLSREEFQFLAEGLQAGREPRPRWFAYVGDEVAGAVGDAAGLQPGREEDERAHLPVRLVALPDGSQRRIDALRIFVLGIKQKFQHLPLGAPLYIRRPGRRA